MASDSRRFLFILRAGPNWYPEKGLSFIARAFEPLARGEIWTFGDGVDTEHAGFRLKCIQIRRRIPTDVVFFSTVLARALYLRFVKGIRFVVVAYDPMRTGALGLLVKRLCRVPLVCEINGVYASEANLIDEPDQEAARHKARRMLRLGHRVLAGADRIKLLFPGQEVGFDVPSTTPRFAFANVVDERLFEEVPPVDESTDKILLFVGTPFFRKGVDVLLRAWALAYPAIPDWTLALVGFDLERHARAAELPVDGVDFVGTSKDVPGWFARAHGLVLPSRSEAMGRVQIEAAFAGRPRLGSDVEGIPHYIEDGVDGLLFPPDDPDALAAVIGRFASDEDLRRRLAEGARRRAQSEFTVENYRRRYREVLSGLRGWD